MDNSWKSLKKPKNMLNTQVGVGGELNFFILNAFLDHLESKILWKFSNFFFPLKENSVISKLGPHCCLSNPGWQKLWAKQSSKEKPLYYTETLHYSTFFICLLQMKLVKYSQNGIFLLSKFWRWIFKLT